MNIHRPFGPTKPTLADAIAGIEQLVDLPETRRRQLISDVGTFARWSGRTPEQVPATVALIRESFVDLTPAGCGVSPGRFANVKSAVGRALDLTGLLDQIRY